MEEILSCEGSETTREVVDAPFLGMVKAWLDGALISLLQWEMPLPVTEELELDGL